MEREAQDFPRLEEIPEFSTFYDLLASSETPPDSTDQPLTPASDPPSSSGNQKGSSHDIPIVITEGSEQEEEGASHEEGYNVAWISERLRKRPEKLAHVEEDNNNSWTHGNLMESIEKDPTVSSIEMSSIERRQRYEHFQNRSTAATILGIPTITPLPVDDRRYSVSRVTGVSIGPGSHAYQLEWSGYNGQSQWVHAEDCECPELIDDFYTLRRDELFAARQAGRMADLENMEHLTEANRSDFENTFLPKHPRWKRHYRAANGRFVRPGTKGSRLEVLRMPTVPPHTREDTARPNSRQLSAKPFEAEVEWLLTQPKPSHAQRSEMRGRKVEDANLDLERTEMQRRQERDAEEGKREVAKKVALEEESRLAKTRQQAEKQKVEAKLPKKLIGKEQKIEEKKTFRREPEILQHAECEEMNVGEKMRQLAKNEKQRKLEDTVRKFNKSALVENEDVETPSSNRKKRRVEKMLAGALESAEQRETVRQRQRHWIEEAVPLSESSATRPNAKLEEARADEANERAKKPFSHVRSEFRLSLGQRQAAAIVGRAYGLRTVA